jgi:hypothetical protein
MIKKFSKTNWPTNQKPSHSHKKKKKKKKKKPLRNVTQCPSREVRWILLKMEHPTGSQWEHKLLCSLRPMNKMDSSIGFEKVETSHGSVC